jgi:Fe-S-cluster containining protein
VTPELAPPCLGCGTCCFSKLATFVRVDGLDHARLGDRADELTVFIGNRCHMTMFEGHCAALVIDVTTRRFVCSVYEDRPAVCRDLERGSPECRAERHEKSERPLLALRTLGGRR